MIRIGHDATYQEAEAERSRAQTAACATLGNPVKTKTKQINKSFFFLETELGALPLSYFPSELFQTDSFLGQPSGECFYSPYTDYSTKNAFKHHPSVLKCYLHPWPAGSHLVLLMVCLSSSVRIRNESLVEPDFLCFWVLSKAPNFGVELFL